MQIYRLGTISDPTTISIYLAMKKKIPFIGEGMLGSHLIPLVKGIGCYLMYNFNLY
jgi:hypothetical protein